MFARNPRNGQGAIAHVLGDGRARRNHRALAYAHRCHQLRVRADERAIIDDGAFIGSDTQLVAPVRVGKRAVVAAGATITEDVRDGALAISRVPCKQVDGYADRLADRYGGKKKATR